MRNLILISLTFLFFQKNLAGQADNGGINNLLLAGAEETISLLKNKEYKSARKSLVELINMDWEFSEDLIADETDLFSKLKKKRWQWRKVKRAFSNNKKGINVPLRNEILKMQSTRETLLTEYQAAAKEGGHRTQVAGKKYKEYLALGKNNLNRLDELFSKNGFLGKDKIGKKGLDIIYSMTKKNADVAFWEKHFSKFQTAYKSGELSANQYAILVDQIEQKKGNPQVFGTFIWVEEGSLEKSFHKIRDEKNVNKRRTALGLNTIEEYAKAEKLEYKYSAQKLKKSDFKKFMGGWDLVNIRNAETNETIFSPAEGYWIEFKRNSRLKYNLDVNTCEIPFQASADGTLKLSKLSKCTTYGPDDPKIKSTLSYNNVYRFELYNELLFLIDDKNQIWELKRKKYKKSADRKAQRKAEGN